MSHVEQTKSGYSLVFDGQAPLGHELVASLQQNDQAESLKQVTALQSAITNLVDSEVPEDKHSVGMIETVYAVSSDIDCLPDESQRPNGILRWLATAEQPELIAFVTENVQRHREAKFVMDSYLEQLGDLAVEAVHHLEEIGFGPKDIDSASLMRTTVRRVGEITVFDRFDAYGIGANGLHWIGTNDVALNRDLLAHGFFTEELAYTGTHEYLHANGDGPTAGLLKNKAGDMARLTRHIEEPVVAHAALAGLGMNFDADSFWPVVLDVAGYVDLREFIAIVAEEGGFEIPVADFIRAHLSPEPFGRLHQDLLSKVDIKTRRLLPKSFSEGGLDAFAYEYCLRQGK